MYYLVMSSLLIQGSDDVPSNRAHAGHDRLALFPIAYPPCDVTVRLYVVLSIFYCQVFKKRSCLEGKVFV